MVLPEIYLDPWEAYDALRPLALFVVSVTLYGVFVFHFYRFLARKDIFQLDLGRHNEAGHPFFRKTVAVAFYLFKNLFLFPLFVSFWFLIMSGLLLLMGKNNSIDSVMIAAIGIVAAIRICAYYNGRTRHGYCQDTAFRAAWHNADRQHPCTYPAIDRQHPTGRHAFGNDGLLPVRRGGAGVRAEDAVRHLRTPETLGRQRGAGGRACQPGERQGTTDAPGRACACVHSH